MIFRPNMRLRTQIVVAMLSGGAAACSGAQSPTAHIPPTEPTHHVVIQGVVVNALGHPLSAISVGARFAASSSPEFQIDVIGGGVTDAQGNYRFEVRTSAPKTQGNVGKFYVHALRYGKAGIGLVEDSVLVTTSLVPRNRVASIVQAEQLQLSVQ